jgi:adenylate cyclase
MPTLPPDDELEHLGLLDPRADDADHRRAALALLVDRGATIEEIRAQAHRLNSFVVEFLVRPRGQRVLLEEASREAGIEPDVVARLWRTLGLPDPATSGRGFAPADIAVLRLFADARRFLGTEHVLQLASVAGSSVTRIADAVVAAFRVAVEVPRRRAGAGDFWFEGLTEALFDDMLPRGLAALDTLCRHAVAATTVQLWATDERAATTTRDLCVGFADMVGFTARSEALVTSDLVAVIDRFEREAADIIARHGGQLIKLIGDEVMYTATDPAAACEIALELVETRGGAGLPEVRAGLAVGPVISRSGDFYGPVVNVAARLANVARPGEVLATAAVWESVCAKGYRLVDAGARTLKGVPEEVEVVRVGRAG